MISKTHGVNRTKIMVFNLLVCCFFINCNSRLSGRMNGTDDLGHLINESQSGAMPLLFFPDSTAEAPGVIFDSAFEDETVIRNGLPWFFGKSKTQRTLTVAYIGGSITRGTNMYRNQSLNLITNLFPKSLIRGVNAGVSGTGSDLGACRLNEQVLRYNPDLIFIEFAVNGAYPQGVEGMIRQIRKFDPSIDICLIYTINGTQTSAYTQGKIPVNIRNLEKIADHYRLPSIHMGLAASMMEKNGTLTWKGSHEDTGGKIIFSGDGIHPFSAGGDLYAQSIVRSLFRLMELKSNRSDGVLPDALFADNWENARMLVPGVGMEMSGKWSTINPIEDDRLRQFAPWFQLLLKTETPGSSVKFKFKGTHFGIFDVGGPEAGQLTIEVDGRPVRLIGTGETRWIVSEDDHGTFLLNRFNSYCNNRYRGQYDLVELPYGVHEVTLTNSAEAADKQTILGPHQQEDILANPAKYDQKVILLGKILINGELIAQ